MNLPDIYLYRCGCGPYFYYGEGPIAPSKFCLVHDEELERIYPAWYPALGPQPSLDDIAKITIRNFSKPISDLLTQPNYFYYLIWKLGGGDGARPYRIKYLKDWIHWSTGVRL